MQQADEQKLSEILQAFADKIENLEKRLLSAEQALLILIKKNESKLILPV